MPDNVGYTPGSGATVAADEIGGILHQRVKIGIGEDGVASDVSATNPMPISGAVNTGLAQPLTNDQLRASSVPVEVVGELVEAIEAMRMAIVSLQKSIGMAQVNPLTGRLLVDPSGVVSPVSQSGTWNITNLATIGGFAANSLMFGVDRFSADGLRRNINVT